MLFKVASAYLTRFHLRPRDYKVRESASLTSGARNKGASTSGLKLLQSRWDWETAPSSHFWPRAHGRRDRHGPFSNPSVAEHKRPQSQELFGSDSLSGLSGLCQCSSYRRRDAPNWGISKWEAHFWAGIFDWSLPGPKTPGKVWPECNVSRKTKASRDCAL
jgi:hypothetical protein